MFLDEAKQLVNNCDKRIRPINNNNELSLYAFRVKDNILYDSKGRIENENEWVGCEWIIEDNLAIKSRS